MTPGELRQELLATLPTNVCEWPGCSDPGQQMAHLNHRGMGGSPAANRLDNVLWLCAFHHDTLDGRTGITIRRYQLNDLLYHAVIKRRPE